MKSARFSLSILVVLSLVVAGSMSAQVTTPAAAAHPVAATLTRSGNVPFFLEANRGQAGPEVEFLARGKGFTLLVKPGEAMLGLTRPATADHPVARTVVSMRMVGSNPSATVVGERALPGRCNYYRGDDPSKWITGVPTYERALVRDVYPGVDLVYRGNQRNLEYDFVVAPGRDPSTIRLAFDGTEKMTLGADGNLILHTAGGEVIQKAPVTFQNSPAGRQRVASAYRILGDREIGFDVGAFDATRPLVIDPVLSYSSYLGGSANDNSNAIAVDGAGSVYVTGSTDSMNFPSTTGPAAAGNGEAFVTKVSTTGQLVYSTYFGGTSGDAGRGIGVDSAGNAYFCGYTSSSDLPVTAGAYDTDPSLTGDDSFVAKLDATGALTYGSYLDGAFAWALALGPGDTVYITGNAGPGLRTKPGAYQPSPIAGPTGSTDAFLARLSLSATGYGDLIYATYLGGAMWETGHSVATDSSGNAYLTGGTFNVTGSTPYFPTTANAFKPNTKNRFKPNGQYHSVFISKIDPSGNGAADLVYSSYLYSKGGLQRGRGVAADDHGRVYVTGMGHDNLPTTAGAFDETYNAGSANWQNVFVVVINTTVSGSAGLEYGTYLSGPGGADSFGIDQRGATVGMAGDIYVAGRALQSDATPSVFPTTPDAIQSQALGDNDAFVAKLNPGGNGSADLVFSTLLGGSGIEVANGVAVDAAGNIHIAGVTASNDFPTANAFQAAPGGGSEDGFVARIQLTATTPPAAPTNLSATAASSSRIDLAWTDNAGDESGFQIERSPDGASWAQIATVGANVTTYANTGLAASTTYHYRVRAYNAIGNSGYSNPANATTDAPGGADDVASGDLPVAGTVTGSYTDTHASDDTYESIQERESGGRRANRHSFLEHKWTFNVTGGSSVVFHLEAHHSANSEGDDFVFAYSTDNVTFYDMVTVTKTADDDVDQSFGLPSSLSGTVYIRVKDTDQTQGNRTKDTIFIDHMFIRSE